MYRNVLLIFRVRLRSNFFSIILSELVNRIKLAVRLHWNVIYLDYAVPGLSPPRKSFPRVRLPTLHNGNFHTVIIEMAAGTVNMYLDCKSQHVV